MTWLYVPGSTSSASAPEAVGSISESSWQFRALEMSAWWRGKPSRSRSWWQRWKRDTSLQLLCGAMCEPSTASLGVASWMASLAASRASRIALPDGSAGNSMGAISGPTPVALSPRPARGSSSSKTSLGCSRRGLMKSLEPSGYGETYANWVSRLRADCSLRQKSARAMRESASSSSGWPTPEANEGRLGFQRRPDGKGQQSLSTIAMLWPTPSLSDPKGGPSTTEIVRQDGSTQSRETGGTLAYAAEQLWYTPNVPNGGRTLTEDTSPTGMTKDGIKRQVGLENQVRSFPPVQATYPVGGIPSKERRSLNPLFVEWLMGWPPGWTLLAWTDFACSATALSLWKRRMRSALLSLGSPAEAPPAQLSLLG